MLFITENHLIVKIISRQIIDKNLNLIMYPLKKAPSRLEPNFSNSWNSWISAPKDDPPSESFFPSAHGDFSPPTFPASFSPKPPAPPVKGFFHFESTYFENIIIYRPNLNRTI